MNKMKGITSTDVMIVLFIVAVVAIVTIGFVSVGTQTDKEKNAVQNINCPIKGCTNE